MSLFCDSRLNVIGGLLESFPFQLLALHWRASIVFSKDIFRNFSLPVASVAYNWQPQFYLVLAIIGEYFLETVAQRLELLAVRQLWLKQYGFYVNHRALSSQETTIIILWSLQRRDGSICSVIVLTSAKIAWIGGDLLQFFRGSLRIKEILPSEAVLHIQGLRVVYVVLLGL